MSLALICKGFFISLFKISDMNYKELLEKEYQNEIYINDYKNTELSKLKFIGDYVFDFTTYDGELTEIMAFIMIEVIEALLNGTTFKYIEKVENYHNYITMLNMPFLIDKIEWGTSIRGAWIEDYNKTHELLGFEIPKGSLTLFLTELIEWSRNV